MSRSSTVLLAILTDLSFDHRCYKLATSLRDAGYHPVILCDRPRHKLGSAWQGFEIRVLSAVSHLENFARAFLVFHLRLALTLLFTRSRVWVALDCPPLLTVALLGKLRGATVIYDSHELFTRTPLVLSRPSRLRFWTFWHDTGVRLTHRIIAVSPTCVDWFHAHHPGHAVFLLPNAPYAADEACAQAPRPGEPVRLIFQGGLRVASGLAETFKALTLLQAQAHVVAATGASTATAAKPVSQDAPRFVLEIYGDGPERASLEGEAQSAALSPGPVFHGQVPFEALRAPMLASHLGLHLMQPVCESFALTLANKLFDYVHAGLPVLLSDNPAHRAFLQKHPVGVVVDSFSPAAVAEGLLRLLAHWSDYHAACLEARKAWHWQAFSKGLPGFIAQGET